MTLVCSLEQRPSDSAAPRVPGVAAPRPRSVVAPVADARPADARPADARSADARSADARSAEDARAPVLRELRRHAGRLCLDGALKHAGWGWAGPSLGEYPRLMRALAAQLAATGEGRLERTWETGWTLHGGQVTRG